MTKKRAAKARPVEVSFMGTVKVMPNGDYDFYAEYWRSGSKIKTGLLAPKVKTLLIQSGQKT